MNKISVLWLIRGIVEKLRCQEEIGTDAVQKKTSCYFPSSLNPLEGFNFLLQLRKVLEINKISHTSQISSESYFQFCSAERFIITRRQVQGTSPESGQYLQKQTPVVSVSAAFSTSFIPLWSVRAGKNPLWGDLPLLSKKVIPADSISPLSFPNKISKSSSDMPVSCASITPTQVTNSAVHCLYHRGRAVVTIECLFCLGTDETILCFSCRRIWLVAVFLFLCESTTRSFLGFFFFLLCVWTV